MREIVSIHIGQAGVQLSNAVWELYCIEHGIQANGLLKENLKDSDSCAFKTFFQETPAGQFVPRALSVDLEPSVLDEVRTGPYRNLWHPDQLISGFEDAANNYARGHFTFGKQYIDLAVERVRKTVDSCDMLQGFMIMDGLGGGTGSGFTALLLDKFGVEYSRRTKFQIIIVPSSHLSTSIVDPYNATLCLNSSTEQSDICAMFDNESIYKLCTNALDIGHPSFNNLNRVLAQVFSSLTVSLRYESFLNADIDQMSTNLIPYPRIHFPVTNYAPIMSARRAERERLSTTELTRSVFQSDNQMISCDMSDGKYMACCLQYRGEVTPKEVNNALFEIKRRTDIKFVSWCPTAFKLGINSQPSVSVPSSEMAQSSRSLTMLANSTAVGKVWDNICKQFDHLFSKRSFVHWYVGEGMEEGEFNEARDEMDSLLQDYIEVGMEESVEDAVEEKEDKSKVGGETELMKATSLEEIKGEEVLEAFAGNDTADDAVEYAEETEKEDDED